MTIFITRYRTYRKHRDYERWERAVRVIGSVAYDIKRSTGCGYVVALLAASTQSPRPMDFEKDYHDLDRLKEEAHLGHARRLVANPALADTHSDGPK